MFRIVLSVPAELDQSLSGERCELTLLATNVNL